MAFFTSAIDTLKILVIALGAGLGAWGVINLLEGYGNDNPGAKSRGSSSLWLIRCNKKAKKGKTQSRRNRRCGQEILWKRKISAIMGAEHLTMERGTGSL